MNDILANPATTLANRLHLGLNTLGQAVEDADKHLFHTLISTAEDTSATGETVPDLVLRIRQAHIRVLTAYDTDSPSFPAQRQAFETVSAFLREWEQTALESHPFAAGLHQAILDRHEQEQEAEGDAIFIFLLTNLEGVVRKNLNRTDLELLVAVRAHLGGLLADEHRLENSIYWGRVQLASQLIDNYVATQEGIQ